MNILEKIVAHKKKEVEERRALYPQKLLEKSIYFSSPCVSFSGYLQRTDMPGIIAEFKRSSPSKGMINQYAPVERTSIGYMQAGASALSILTDTAFFGGKNEDLITARKFNYCPILRKDFFIDEYQVMEAKAIGADVVLLLANVLDAKTIKSMAKLARSLGMEVLLEVRDVKELDSVNEYVNAVGVNNRDLRNFKVDVKQSYKIGEKIPKQFIKVSESGIDSPDSIREFRKAGFKGFLIGEAFMRHGRPEVACADFIKSIRITNRG
jgi:indole-3-glycerol phosphate synthase